MRKEKKMKEPPRVRCPICGGHSKPEHMGEFSFTLPAGYGILPIISRACQFCTDSIARSLGRLMRDMERPQ